MSSSSYGQRRVVDRVAAIVAGKVITEGEVKEKISAQNIVEVSAFPSSAEASEFEKALNDLINKKLVISEVEQAEMDVSTDEVEEEIDRFLSQKGLDRDGLLGALQQQGIRYENYFEDFKDQMLLKKFQGRFIMPSVKVTDRDLELYYFKTLGSSPTGVKLQLRQLFLSLGSDDTAALKESKQELLEKIIEQLESGLAFDEAVRLYSDNLAARKNGGRMPILELSDLAVVFRDAVGPLKPGQVSAPVVSDAGIHIFFLEKRKISDSSDFERRKSELRFRLRREQIDKQMQRWLADRRSRSRIRILVGEANEG